MNKHFVIALFITFFNGYYLYPQEKVRINENSNQEVVFSDLFESAKIVPLETSKKCFISRISVLKTDTNRIFILDKKIKSVFIFNIQGKFIKKVGQVGKGPGEFIRPTDILLDKLNKRLEVLDKSGQKILIYDYEGNFIKSKTAIWIQDFEKLNDSTYIGYSYNYPIADKNQGFNSVLVAFNGDGTIIKEFHNIGNIPRRINTITDHNLLKDEKGNVFLVPILEYGLYRINESLQINKICDFKSDTKITERILDVVKDINAALKKFLDLDSPFFIMQVHIIGNQLKLSFAYRMETYLFFWNMDTNKTFTIAKKMIINDLAPVDCYGLKGAYQDGLIDIIPAIDFVESLKKSKYNSAQIKYQPKVSKESLSKLADKVSAEDNNILIFYKYK